jgi:hypothetical protein
MYGNSANIIRQDLNLASMHSGPNLQTQAAHGITDGFSTTHGAGRAIKRCKKPIAGRPDFLPAKSGKFATHARVMPLQEVAPFAVAE